MLTLKICADFSRDLLTSEECPDKSLEGITWYVASLICVDGVEYVLGHLLHLVLVDKDVSQILSGFLEVYGFL